MGTSRNESRDDAPPERGSAAVILATIGDTTWRMFVPIVGLLLVGRWADDEFGLGHLGMAIGTIIGCIIAGVLIKRQLDKKV